MMAKLVFSHWGTTHVKSVKWIKVKLQTLAANTGLVTLISGTTLPITAIRSLKAGWPVRMKAWPARCVVGEWSESASLL